jgi:ribosomal protein S12 methylthiotransferase accessory factor YcaO
VLKVGPMVYKEALDNFTLEVMEGYAKIVWQATPNFFDSIMFSAVRGAILDILNKINRADFF